MPRVALLGDSIFDNKAYVGAEPDVVGHLRRNAQDGWSFDLHAVDGSLVSHVSRQVEGIAEDVTHLFVSAGGNNALSNADILQMRVSNAAEVWMNLADRTDAFRADYNKMLSRLVSAGRPFAVSTVYYPNFVEPTIQRIASAALASFNDVIIVLAAQYRVPILDFRLICSERGDYANEIEPSGRGGAKIASAIIRMTEKQLSGESGPRIYW